MESIDVEVLNWGKHQRKDVKHPTWFALSNDILSDPKLFLLSDVEFKALIYVFCQCSKSHSARTTIYFDHAHRTANIPAESMRTALIKLANAGVTRTLRGRAKSARARHSTDRQTDKTDTTPQDAALPRLVCLWNEIADPVLPRVVEIDPKTKRGRDCEARWSEKPEESFWSEVIKKINDSDFCKGGGKTGWVANFAWMVRKGKAAEILEGNFGSRSPKQVAI